MNLRDLQLVLLSGMAECRECEGNLGTGFACVTCKQASELVAEMAALAASTVLLEAALVELERQNERIHSNETRAAYQHGVLAAVSVVRATLRGGAR